MRRESNRRAALVMILYRRDLLALAESADVEIEGFLADPEIGLELKSSVDREWVATRIERIARCQDRLDQEISERLDKWELNRLGYVERAILRVAMYELVFDEARIDPPIALNEAVELAKRYCDPASAGLVNAALDSALKSRSDGGKLEALDSDRRRI